MLISHEVPMCLLEKSRTFNDYDYALVHMFEKYPAYYSFYKESLKQGRVVYLDNSVFELETMFDSDVFSTYCIELGEINPENFFYIVPDSLEDKDRTIESFASFKQRYGNIPGNTVGVAQGSTESDVIECFEYMKENADVVAISFDYSFWDSADLTKSMQCRVDFVHKLKSKGYLDNVKVHLLGCYLPQEVSMYSDVPEIVSMDTSNPVVHGIKGIRYKDTGLESKESIKLIELFNIDNVPDDVFYNIKKFRSFLCK